MALDLLLWAIGIGATSAGMTTAVRTLPFAQKLMMERKKPWVCDVCMSFWTTGALGLALSGWRGLEWVLVCGPAFPWALWVLQKINEPQGSPLPALENIDELSPPERR